MQVKLSRHAREDRLGRLSYCLEHFGLGEVIATQHIPTNHTYEKLTSTGLVLVEGENGVVVTGFLATATRARVIYVNAHNEEPPQWFLSMVRVNHRKIRG